MAVAGLAGGSVLTSGLVGDAAAKTTVDLGERGLRSGGVIDDYLAEHLESGAEVHVPAGEYEWRGDGLSGEYADAALVGDGPVTLHFSGNYWNVNVLAVGGGDVRFENLTVRGKIDSGGNKSRFRFDARHADSTVTLKNVNLPDGDASNGRAIGIYVGPEHAGTVHLTDCHVEGFPNNGLYAGAYGRSGGGGGRVVVENSFFKNNNVDAIRIGGDRDVVRNCVIVQEQVPAIHSGGKSGRGIRVRYPGDDITVENVHVTCATSAPLIVPDRSNGPSGTIDGLYVENDTDERAVEVETGSFRANDVHVSGSGNLAVAGFEATSNVRSGADAASPATSLAELE